MNANNEFVSFVADTLPLSQAVRLTLQVQAPHGVDRKMAYQVYRIGRVALTELNADEAPTDSSFYRGVTFEAAGQTRINRRTYVRNLFILPDSLYRDVATQYTYQNLNALAAVNYSNIHYAQPAPGDSIVNVHLLVQLNKPNGNHLRLGRHEHSRRFWRSGHPHLHATQPLPWRGELLPQISRCLRSHSPTRRLSQSELHRVWGRSHLALPYPSPFRPANATCAPTKVRPTSR